MLLHLEFYPVRTEGSPRTCERIAYGTSSVDQAIVHARDVLENRTFAFGKAKLCLIKNEEGKVLCQMRARKLRPGS
jgi:hypothetical protein